MIHALRVRVLVLLLFSLAVPTWGQDVLRVDELGTAGAFTDIQPAIDAAGEGDLLLLASGTYGSFVVDGKSVRIMEDVGATAKIAGSMFVTNLTASQSVELHGLEHESVKQLGSILRVSNAVGSVLVQDCEFVSLPTLFQSTQYELLAGLRIVDSNAVTLNRVVVDARLVNRGFSNTPFALFVKDSNAFLSDCEFFGSTGVFIDEDDFFSIFGYSQSQLSGSSAGFVRGGRVVMKDCSLTGGDGLNGAYSPGGVTAGPDCAPGGNGGEGLVLVAGNGDPAVTLIGANLQSGAWGQGGSGTAFGVTLTCSDGAPASPLIKAYAGSASTIQTGPRRLSGNSVVRPGESKDNTITGPGSSMMWQVYSFKTGSPLTYDPQLLGLAYYGGSSIVQFRGTLPISGIKTVSQAITDIGIDFLPIYEQVFFYNSNSGFSATNPRFVALLGSSVP